MAKFLRLPIALAVVVLAGIAVIANLSAYTVEQGERGVLLRFGSVKDVSQPGLHFKVPFMDTVRMVNVRTQIINWGGPGVMQTYSRDQQPAELTVRVSYSIKPDNDSVSALYSQYGSVRNYEAAVIAPRAAQQIKTTFGQFNAVTAVQERAELNLQSQDAIVAAVTGPGRIEGVEIQNIDFSDAYEDSIEARMQAEVEVQRVNQNLERERTNAQIRVVQAQAEADAVRLAGEAEAAAIRARGEALRDSPDLIALNAVEKWDGVLPTSMPPNAAVPILQLPQGNMTSRAAPGGGTSQ
jgi:regulator of protease activity HflC (stomatin/prohibitin superfamily)